MLWDGREEIRCGVFNGLLKTKTPYRGENMKNRRSFRNNMSRFSRRNFISGTGIFAATSLCGNKNAEGVEYDCDNLQSIKNLQAIDVHAHYGIYTISELEIMNQFYSGDAETIISRAQRANTRFSIVSPMDAFFKSKADIISANKDAAQMANRNKELLQWVVLDPLTPDTSTQATEMLKQPGCVGIKIHPEQHLYPISEQGKAIFELAAKHRAVILTHSGDENSIPEDYVPFANDFPEVKLILAHLGNGYDGDPAHQVRAIQAGKHDNIFVDTSSSMSITSKLIEWAVKEVGAERMLYGTDTPVYFSPMHRARIDNADISSEDKELILYKNAEKILNI